MTAPASSFHPEPGAILAKLETSEGTDSTPALGADEIPVISGSVQWSEGVQHGECRLVGPQGGEYPAPAVSRRGTWGFTTPLFGKGLSTGVIVQPNWMRALLQSCGIVTIGSGDTSKATWEPTLVRPREVDHLDAVNEKLETLSLWRYFGRSLDDSKHMLQKMLGARVGSITFDFSVGNFVRATFSGSGIPVETADTNAQSGSTDILASADLDDFAGDLIVPDLLSSQFVAQGSSASEYSGQSAFTVTVSWGQAGHVSGDGAAGGVQATSRGDISVTFTINPIVTLQSDYDYINRIWQPIQYSSNAFDELRLTTTDVFPVGRSTNQGYGVALKLYGVQGIGELTGADGRIRLPISGKATRITAQAKLMELELF